MGWQLGNTPVVSGDKGIECDEFSFYISNYPRSEIEEQGDVRIMDIRGVILTAHYINMGSPLSSSSLYLSVGAPRQRIHITTSTRHPAVSIVMKIGTGTLYIFLY